jgi:hypothetical protein
VVTQHFLPVVGNQEDYALEERIIANSLTEQCRTKTVQISGFWAVDGQT